MLCCLLVLWGCFLSCVLVFVIALCWCVLSGFVLDIVLFWVVCGCALALR